MKTLTNLGECLMLQRRYEPAFALIRRALVLGEANWGMNDPQLAPALNILAGIYRDLRQLDEATIALERALAMQQSVGNREHMMGSILNNVGDVALLRRRYPEADKWFAEALQVFEKIYGPEHVEVGKVLNNLAESSYHQNRHIEAEAYFRRALAICDRSLPGDHPQTLQALVNYARLLRKTGRKQDASRLEKRVAQGVESRKKTDPREGLIIDYRAIAR
jgi:Tfp pilus assembly protein PilF